MLDKGERSASGLGRLIPAFKRPVPIGDVVECASEPTWKYGEEENICTSQDSNPGFSARYSDHHTLLTYLLTYLITYLLTYLLTPWNTVHLEKLTGFQLVKKFPAFHGTRRFITAVTSSRHLSLSWASSILSIPHIPLPEDPY